jgi:hypothetical protein
VRRNGSGEEEPDSGSRSSAKKKLKKKIRGKGEGERGRGGEGPRVGWPGSAGAGLLPGFGPRVRPSGWPFSLSFFFFVL